MAAMSIRPSNGYDAKRCGNSSNVITESRDVAIVRLMGRNVCSSKGKVQNRKSKVEAYDAPAAVPDHESERKPYGTLPSALLDCCLGIVNTISTVSANSPMLRVSAPY